MYFHPLFTELKNIDPLAQNWRICRGGWGPPGGHFGPFWEIWRLNADKNEKICTFLGFKSWIMVKEVCQMVKTENFVNHWPAGALQGRRDSIIPFYPQINNHIVNMAIPAWIHTLLKNKIGQNGSKNVDTYPRKCNWPCRMHTHWPIARYTHICMVLKKNFRQRGR